MEKQNLLVHFRRHADGSVASPLPPNFFDSARLLSVVFQSSLLIACSGGSQSDVPATTYLMFLKEEGNASSNCALVRIDTGRKFDLMSLQRLLHALPPYKIDTPRAEIQTLYRNLPKSDREIIEKILACNRFDVSRIASLVSPSAGEAISAEFKTSFLPALASTIRQYIKAVTSFLTGNGCYVAFMEGNLASAIVEFEVAK